LETAGKGKPSAQIIKYWQKKGLDVSHKTKWYTPVQLKERKRKISQKYKISMCCLCHDMPSIKLIWKLDGINRVEYYCNDCYNKGDNG
jgi:hypothetical protein